MLVWDIETGKRKGNKIKLELGAKEYLLIGLYDGKEYCEFHDFKSFLKHLKKYKSDYLIGHNAGKYDNLYLFEYLYNNKDDLNVEITNIRVINGRLLFNLKFSKRKIIKLRDSFLLLPSSLDSLGKSFDTEYKKIEINYDEWYDEKTISEYLKHDVLTLYHVLKTFEKEIKELVKVEIDVIQKETLASLSFYILLNVYGVKDKIQNYFKKKVEDWMRQGYYGGRVEVFKRKGENLYYYDVNSLYPYVMYKYDYPLGNYFILTKHKGIKHIIENTDFLGVVEVEVYKEDDSYINYLGVKYNGKLIFPYGKWKGIYTAFEIREALKRGYKFKYIKGIFFMQKERIFKDFIDDMYKFKQYSKGTKRYIAKLLLNSSYGKFGQRRKYKKIIMFEDIIKKGLDISKFEEIGEGVFAYEYEDYRNRNINPVYAMHITAYARHELYLMMEKVGFRHIYYCDTDSIITDVEIDSEYIHDSELGKWKLEDEIKEGIFLSNKFYTYINKDDEVTIKAKGIDRKKIKMLCYQDFEDLLNGKKIEVTLSRLISFLEKFRLLETRRSKDFVLMRNLKKILEDSFDKREILNDKINTKSKNINFLNE